MDDVKKEGEIKVVTTLDGQAILFYAQARLNEATIFLNGLAEIRSALNYPMVSEEAGIGEHTKLEPIFDELERGRLKARYFRLIDRYMGYTKNLATMNKLLPETDYDA